MKVNEILNEFLSAEASADEETPEKELIRTKRGFMVWFEQGDGLRKYAIAKLGSDGDVVDVQSAVTSRNGIKTLYTRRQAKAIVEIITKEHPDMQVRMIRASLEKYGDGSVSVNVG